MWPFLFSCAHRLPNPPAQAPTEQAQWATPERVTSASDISQVVATREIGIGERLAPADIEVQLWPRVGPWENDRSVESVIGRVAIARLLQGEPVLEKRLADPEHGVTLGAAIRRGMRATRVEVREVDGIEPANYVDLLRTSSAGTRTVVHAVEVLRVDRASRTLVVAVTPEQAQWLAGPWPTVVALRNPIDVLHNETHGALGEHGAPEGLSNGASPSVGMARRQLFPGVTIAADDLWSVPAVDHPQGVPLDDLIGRLPKEWIAPYEIVRPDRLADPVNGSGIAAVIPRGMRGISLQATGAAGWLSGGDYVDVVASVEQESTVTLLQALFVLRAGTDSVMLLATANDAEKLAHIQNTPGTALTLRNDWDVKAEHLEPTTFGK